MPVNSSREAISGQFKMIYDRISSAPEKSARGIAFAKEFLVPQAPESWMQFEDLGGKKVICTKTATDRNEVLVVNDSGLFIVISTQEGQGLFQKLNSDMAPLTTAMAEASKNSTGTAPAPMGNEAFSFVVQVDPHGENKLATYSATNIVEAVYKKVSNSTVE